MPTAPAFREEYSGSDVGTSRVLVACARGIQPLGSATPGVAGTAWVAAAAWVAVALRTAWVMGILWVVVFMGSLHLTS